MVFKFLCKGIVFQLYLQIVILEFSKKMKKVHNLLIMNKINPAIFIAENIAG